MEWPPWLWSFTVALVGISIQISSLLFFFLWVSLLRLDFQVINRTVLAYCNYLSCGHKLLNCSYLRATPKLHWSFWESFHRSFQWAEEEEAATQQLHALHRRILDNATNLYWSSRGQKNEKMLEKRAAYWRLWLLWWWYLLEVCW